MRYLAVIWMIIGYILIMIYRHIELRKLNLGDILREFSGFTLCMSLFVINFYSIFTTENYKVQVIIMILLPLFSIWMLKPNKKKENYARDNINELYCMLVRNIFYFVLFGSQRLYYYLKG